MYINSNTQRRSANSYVWLRSYSCFNFVYILFLAVQLICAVKSPVFHFNRLDFLLTDLFRHTPSEFIFECSRRLFWVPRWRTFAVGWLFCLWLLYVLNAEQFVLNTFYSYHNVMSCSLNDACHNYRILSSFDEFHVTVCVIAQERQERCQWWT